MVVVVVDIDADMQAVHWVWLCLRSSSESVMGSQ